MDKTIHKHLDKKEAIYQRIQELILQTYQELSLPEILTNPENELAIFSEDLTQKIIDKFSTELILEGVNFADEVMKMPKPVEIQPGNDPKLNEDAG